MTKNIGFFLLYLVKNEVLEKLNMQKQRWWKIQDPAACQKNSAASSIIIIQ